MWSKLHQKRHLSIMLAILLLLNGSLGYMPQMAYAEENTQGYEGDDALLIEEDDADEMPAAGEQQTSDDTSASLDTVDVIDMSVQDMELGDAIDVSDADLLGTSLAADLPTGQTSNVTLTAQAVAGGTMMENNRYVWNVDSLAAGHRFLFNVHYDMSGEKDLAPGAVEITLPATILRDRAGQQADVIDLPYPKVTESEAQAVSEGSYATDYIYYEKEGTIHIVNSKMIPSASIGDFDVVYETTKVPMEYFDEHTVGADGADISGSAPFLATLSINNVFVKETEPITVYLNTTARISSVNKGIPTLYRTWNPAWGEELQPENSEDYYYLIWEIRSAIWNPNQYYTLQLTDQMDRILGEVLGFKMAGKSQFARGTQQEDGGVASEAVKRQSGAGYRYDYVLTKHAKESFEHYTGDHYRVTNRISATLTPEDQVDAPTTVSATRHYDYYAPTFNGVQGSSTLSKHGNQHWASRYGVHWDYASYELGKLTDVASQASTSIGGLRYNVHMNTFPYPWTLERGADASDPNKYGKRAVTYQIDDDMLFLFNNEEDDLWHDTRYKKMEAQERYQLTRGDYDFEAVDYSVAIAGAQFNTDTMQFDKVAHPLDDEDKLQWYIKTADEDEAEWIEAASITLGMQAEAEIKSDKVDSLSKSRITFRPGVTAYRAQLCNAYYNTTIDLNPYVRLYATDHVKDLIGSADTIILKNKAGLTVLDADEQSIDRLKQYAIDGDRIRKVERTSVLNKHILSTSNETTRKIFMINWNVEQRETIQSGTSQDDVNEVLQNGGVFYDLLPKGSTLRISSVKVESDGGALAANEYTVSQIPNYHGSGRTMLKVEVHAEKPYFDVNYTTMHTWESLKDYGAAVNNPVAYETGNADIASGYPDDGGNLSSQNKDYYVDLNPNTDANKFIYAEENQFITVVTAAVSGLDKKTMTMQDDSWSYETTVSEGDIYQYRLRYSNATNTYTNSIILYDNLEQFKVGEKSSEWAGRLLDIDVSQMERLGANPVIYYAKEHVSLSGGAGVAERPEIADLNNTTVWTRLEDKSQLEDLQPAMIAICLDESFRLEPGASIAAVLYMRAPDHLENWDEQRMPQTFNDVWLYANVWNNKNTEDAAVRSYINQSHTTVTYHVTGSLAIHKVSELDENTVIPGVSFRISGTSVYGTAVNITKTTNSRGNLSFGKLEMGTYTLQEVSGVEDYLEDHTEKTVEVDTEGNVKVDGEMLRGSLTVTNKPRVHADVRFMKGSLERGEQVGLPDAVFRISGTSDYGNKVLMTSTSDGSGQVSFDNLERGTYIMAELRAPENYIRQTSTWKVIVDQNASVAISGDDVEYDLQRGTVLRNEKYHQILLFKISDYDQSTVAGAGFKLSGMTEQGKAYESTPFTTEENGLVRFDHLEAGTYFLQETKAPDGYQRDETKRSVIVNRDGTYTIEGLKLEEDGFYRLVNQRIPDGEIVVIKKWIDEDPTKRVPPTVHVEELTATSNDTIIEEETAGLASAARHLLDTVTGTQVVYGAEVEERVIVPVNSGVSQKNGNTRWDVYLENGKYVLEFSRAEPNSNGEADIPASNRTWQWGSTKIEVNGVWKKVSEAIDKVRFKDKLSIDNCNNFLKDFSNATEIDLTNLDMSKSTKMSGMFQGCAKLESIDMHGLDLLSAETVEKMFMDCTNIKKVNMSAVRMPNVKDFFAMFYKCTSLEELDLSSITTENGTRFQEMFAKCTNLKTLDISNFTIGKTANTQWMFFESPSISRINLGKNFRFNNNNQDNKIGLLPQPDNNAKWTYYTPRNIKGYTPDEVKNLFNAGNGIAGWWMWQDPSGSEANKERYDSRTATGEWKIIDENTWSYTFPIYNTDENQKWEVWEDDVEGYVGDASASKKRVITGYKKPVVITNIAEQIASRTYGDLHVKKVVEGDHAPQGDQFAFQITLTEDNPDQPIGGISGIRTFGNTVFQDGVATVFLKAEELVEITDIPAGLHYTVTEMPKDNYASTPPENASGTIQEKTKGAIEVEFTNTYTPPAPSDEPEEPGTGSITLRKIVEGAPEGGEGENYHFTVKLANLTPEAPYTLADGITCTADDIGQAEITLSLADQESVTIDNLPLDTHYQIEEDGGNYLAAYQISDAAGMQSIVKESAQSTEKNAPLSTAEETLDEGEEVTVVFTNTLTADEEPVHTGTLTIKKQVVNLPENMQSGTYSFTVHMEGLTPGMTLETSRGSITASGSGKAEVGYMLGDAEEVTIEGIPEGAVYRVTEEACDMVASYQISVDGEETHQEGGNENTNQALVVEGENGEMLPIGVNAETCVTVTNTYIPEYKGTLTFSKQVAGNMGERKRAFNFTITMHSASGNPVYGLYAAKVWNMDDPEPAEKTQSIEFSQGMASIRLKHNQIVKLLDIPEGFTYCIEEDDYSRAGYTTQVNGQSVRRVEGAISENGNPAPIYAFINTRDVGIPTAARTGLPLFTVMLLAGGMIVLLTYRRRKRI